MQSFYLTKNQHGYFSVRFPDPVTGVLGTAKSTHSKNRQKATLIANDWLCNGVPAGTSCERVLNNPEHPVDLEKFVNRLSDSEIGKLYEIISKRVNNCITFPAISKTTTNTERSSQRTTDSPTLPSSPTPLSASNSSVVSKPILLLDALFNFWDFENSEYVKKRIARGYDIKQRNCKEKLGIVRRYWAKYFDADRTIQSLTPKELDEFLLYLRMEKELSADTVNKTMTAGNMAFDFLVKEGLIDSNPLASVERFKVSSKKRGIPTETEMRQLMSLDWDWTDSAYKLAFKVAALFGLRAGEISGLQVCDVDVVGDLLYIRHSWNDVDKLKSTKNGDDRTIPIEHEIAVELLNNARRNPEYSDTSFVFWSAKVAGQPIWPSSFEDDFYIAMQKIGISEEQRKERNIVVHSLRHYCATQIAQRTSLEIAMKILGHKTEEMTRLYSEHETKVKLNNAKEVLSQGWKILTA